MIEEKELLKHTQLGSRIFTHILSSYYPNQVVMEQVGRQCKPTRNPFNENKPTLDIHQGEDSVFYFQDMEKPEQKGNAFDFAALHYQLKGQELLRKIHDELHLNIYDKDGYKLSDKGKTVCLETGELVPAFSFYYAPISNIHPHTEVTVMDIFKAIKGPRYRERTAYLRSLTAVHEIRKYKASKFDYVTFAGVFSQRKDKSLIKQSGLLTIDFDNVKNVRELKEAMIYDPNLKTVLAFVSPSGTGLKCIISVNLEKYPFITWFEGAAGYIKRSYGLEIDPSGKDLSRACFLPHDPEVYMKPEYFNTTFL